jgi:hypothetical protein
MAANQFAFHDFPKTFERELGRIKRYNYNSLEKLSLMYMHFSVSDIPIVLSILPENLRSSDAIYQRGSHFFLLLPHTSREGALHVQNVITDILENSFKTVVVSFPEDGESVNDLFEMMEHTADEEYEISIERFWKNVEEKVA